MRYNKDTVRKNVTISKELSDNLEQSSWCTGVSQSAIIEAAFKQPSMRRLFAFCRCEEEDNCVVNLLDAQSMILDTYVDGYGPGSTIVSTLIDEYLPVIVMKQGVSVEDVRAFHTYAERHMTVSSIDRSLPMKEAYEDFKNGTFYCSVPGEFRLRMKLFMMGMLGNHDLLVDSYLYRILAYIFENLTVVPENVRDDIMKSVFRELCKDKRVFGIAPAWV